MMPEKRNIVIAGPYPQDIKEMAGGAHAHILDIVEQFKSYDNLDVHVVTVSKSIKKDKIVHRDNTTIHYISSPKLPLLLTSLTIDSYRVSSTIRRLNPHLVHAHTEIYGFPAIMSGIHPIVLTVHGITLEEAKTWRGLTGFIKGIIYGLTEKHVLKKIQNVIVDTPYVKERIKPLCRGHITVIPIGINEDYFSIRSDEKKDRILFVGGIEPRKGLEHLLKAIKIIKEEIPSVNLHICGRIRIGNYFNELREYTELNNITENVFFLGFLSEEELKREYGECSVFVLPSKEESQGLVLLEAMAAGKPVVASDIGGIPYVVEDNKTGFLVAYGNPRHLTEKVIRLLKDERLRREMGEKGREKAKEFLNRETARKIYELYNQIIKDNI